MELKNCSTAVFVRDIETSKDFYCNLLGLQVDLDLGKNVIFRGGFTIWEIQDSHIIPQILGVEKISNAAYNRFELYFETDDLQDIYSVLKGSSTRFLHEIHEESWGQRTLRFFDPDNHLIEVGESMQKFVVRFIDQGLGIEEVSRKTHIPAEEIKRLIDK
jgi:catechol 2,3-dioxygenase-like lactoylglutathione lyase family enzyme